MSASKPLGPFKLVTVNTAPERAKRLIGRVVEDVKDKYTIIHAGNADSKSTQSIIRLHTLIEAQIWSKFEVS